MQCYAKVFGSVYGEVDMKYSKEQKNIYNHIWGLVTIWVE
jgi:hypothetical protein